VVSSWRKAAAAVVACSAARCVLRAFQLLGQLGGLDAGHVSLGAQSTDLLLGCGLSF
jgi:hypothetical protein